jgi:hypothetical protein
MKLCLVHLCDAEKRCLGTLIVETWTYKYNIQHISRRLHSFFTIFRTMISIHKVKILFIDLWPFIILELSEYSSELCKQSNQQNQLKHLELCNKWSDVQFVFAHRSFTSDSGARTTRSNYERGMKANEFVRCVILSKDKM